MSSPSVHLHVERRAWNLPPLYSSPETLLAGRRSHWFKFKRRVIELHCGPLALAPLHGQARPVLYVEDVSSPASRGSA